ncbi:NAD(P)-dependent dehydrogenase (short-subunit alcohol dehydrogenase family) [Sphingopyxis panaciterrae]|uniref:SDR family oxidoreductase n=1 Tax=Sphingopyxis panaciterrae TaxID=363841 RepID=UPI00141F9E8F|nr:SDR family oxidoreductase [Sphingopyxis panaciterrae]NIJ37694.1 NAD(P)-dependent dehydrogenase (short-subunit alcohol dehydrogenase family) [Sphingopyxis panaciterrae]
MPTEHRRRHTRVSRRRGGGRYATDPALGAGPKALRSQRFGRVINTTSVAGLRTHTHMGEYLYDIAKAAVAHATRLAAVELGRQGVTVNSIAPGAIATPIFFGGSQAASQLDPAHAEGKLRKLTAKLASEMPRHVAGMPWMSPKRRLFLPARTQLTSMVMTWSSTAGRWPAGA